MSTFDPELFPSVPGKKVVLHCAVGKRSEAAGKMLLNEGYEGAIHMIGGIQEWKAAGYATEVQFVAHPGPRDIVPADEGESAAAASPATDTPETAAFISPPPGEVLTGEFLEPLGIEQKELAADIGVFEESSFCSAHGAERFIDTARRGNEARQPAPLRDRSSGKQLE